MTTTNTLEEHLRKQMVLGLVQHHIFCPVTETVMDVRTCVVFVDSDGDPNGVMSQEGYKILLADRPETIEKLKGMNTTVDERTVRS